MVRYTTVDDVGLAINPLIVDGRPMGIVRGQVRRWASSALDRIRTATGGSLWIIATESGRISVIRNGVERVPSPTIRLGVKAGDGGTTPALAVLVNGFGRAAATSARY